jgi:hypothetical protein
MSLKIETKSATSYTNLYNAEKQKPIQIDKLSNLAKAYAIDAAISDKYFNVYIEYLKKKGKLPSYE